MNADDDSLTSSSEPPRLTPTPPPMATRLDAAAVVLAVLFTVALLDSVHFRLRLAAVPDA